MSHPLVSICIPNYNNARYLDACIQSALSQDYPNFEIIFVDDCSTDASLDVARKYSDKIIIHSNNHNLGQPKNTNRCIEYSNGSYIVILHSDDLLLPCFASKLVPLLEHNKNVCMGVGERILTNENDTQTHIAPFYDGNYIIPGIKQAKVFMFTSFLPCQVLFRKDNFIKSGGVNENHIVNLDGLLWFKLSLSGDVAYIQDHVCIYRVHGEQTTAKYNQTIDHMIEYYYTLKEMMRIGNKFPYLQQFYEDAVKHIAELTIRYCHDVMMNKDYDLARRYLFLAGAFDPNIISNSQYRLIDKCLLSKRREPYDVYRAFIQINKPRDRGFSYKPPEGSIPID